MENIHLVELMNMLIITKQEIYQVQVTDNAGLQTTKDLTITINKESNVLNIYMSKTSSNYDPVIANNDFATRDSDSFISIVNPRIDTTATNIIRDTTKIFPKVEKLKTDPNKINTTINNWKNGDSSMVIGGNTYYFLEPKAPSTNIDKLYEYILDNTGNIQRSSKSVLSVTTWDDPLLFNEEFQSFNEDALDNAMDTTQRGYYEFAIGSLAMDSTNADAYVLIALFSRS